MFSYRIRGRETEFRLVTAEFLAKFEDLSSLILLVQQYKTLKTQQRRRLNHTDLFYRPLHLC
jgi:hypothetical protein